MARLRAGTGALALGVAVVVTLAGCGAATTSPSSLVGATPTTGAAASPASSPRAASASPAADPGTAAVKAFVALASNPKASYQAAFTGVDRHTTDTLKIT